MTVRVLFVDDVDGDLEKLLSDQPHGMQFIVVRDIYMALYLLLEFDIEHSIDLIVGNLDLECGNLIHLLRYARADRCLASIPQVLFTIDRAGAQPEHLDTVANLYGADSCMAMTVFDPPLLCRHLQQMLRRR